MMPAPLMSILRSSICQTAVQRRRYARSEVASHAGGAEKYDLRFFRFDQSAHDRRVGQRAERIENSIIGNPYRVGSVFRQLLAEALYMVADDHGFQFHMQRIGQFPTFGQQFEAHIGDLAAFELDIYKYVVHLLRAD